MSSSVVLNIIIEESRRLGVEDMIPSRGSGTVGHFICKTCYNGIDKIFKVK